MSGRSLTIAITLWRRHRATNRRARDSSSPPSSDFSRSWSASAPPAMACSAVRSQGCRQADSVIRTYRRTDANRSTGRRGAGQSLLDSVEAVADGLQLPGGGGGEDLGVLLQRPHSLAQPFAGGRHHVGQVGPVLLGGGGDGRADVAGGVTVQDGGGQERAGGGGQIVPERLQVTAEAVVVEDEPGVVLEYPQGLTGAVGVGVEEPLDRPRGAAIHVSHHGRPIIGPAVDAARQSRAVSAWAAKCELRSPVPTRSGLSERRRGDPPHEAHPIP